jgi:hypothetical protein
MLRCVAFVRTGVSEELGASIRVTRIGELGTTLAVTSNRHMLRRNASMRRLLVTASVAPSSLILITLMKVALSSSKTLVLTRATRRNIPEDTTLHSHRRENLKSYKNESVYTYKNFLIMRPLCQFTLWSCKMIQIKFRVQLLFFLLKMLIA